ncbi:hypothetical protein GUJ93_ZPchr0014g46577 [Zizania palustris]|uniref:Uncharacterized protein n=1 Tax=Zizania palustris TaxID=103762 RepID=A0A8J5W0S6_ZIZPA|nr:hypothetical protein GUJ93_ZPchr0014g46577 [Zizania palustris]
MAAAAIATTRPRRRAPANLGLYANIASRLASPPLHLPPGFYPDPPARSDQGVFPQRRPGPGAPAACLLDGMPDVLVKDVAYLH